MTLLYEIVSEIAAREGVAPTDLDPPLNDVIDVEMLEALITGADSRQDRSSRSVEFVYKGYTVSVDGTGKVTVSDSTEATAASSGRASESLLESAAAEMGHREGALQEVGDIVAARYRPFEKRLEGLLEVVRKTLGVDSATLSYVDDDSYVFEAVDTADTVDLQAGEIVPLADTACKRVIETEQALVLRDVAVDAPELVGTACDVATYIGVPVFVDGAVYGTFCFFDQEPRDEAFSDWELAVVELLSDWVSSELERRRLDRALHASTFERPSEMSP